MPNEIEYIVSRDGEELFRGTEWECVAWLHNHCPSSADWAMRYEGYSISQLTLEVEV